MSEQKKLYRDTENGKIFGVCAGLADYFSVDVTIIRVLFVFLVLCGTIGLWPYIILAILIEPKSVVLKREQDNIHKAETVEPGEDDDPFAKYDKKL